MSRKLVANLFYSVDGVAEDPFNFQYDSFDDDLGRLLTEGIAKIDANILGRVTYQEWAGYWPTITEGEDVGFADFINGTPKFVASTSMKPAEMTWSESHLIDGDLLGFVRDLKGQAGGDIAVQGSLSITRQLVEAGLMDELTLIMHPAVASGGRRLFDDSKPMRLTLLDVKPTQKGNVIATYGPFSG